MKKVRSTGRGFSLTEIMIAVSIGMILLVIGMVSWRSSQANLELRRRSQQIELFISQARAEATKRCTAITISGENGSSLNGAYKIVALGEGYNQSMTLPSGITLAGPDCLGIRANGTLDSGAELTVSSENTTSKYRLVYSSSGSGSLVAVAAPVTSSGEASSPESGAGDQSSGGTGSSSGTGSSGNNPTTTGGSGSSSDTGTDSGSGGIAAADPGSTGSGTDPALSGSDGPQGTGDEPIQVGDAVLELTNTFLENNFLQDKFNAKNAANLEQAYTNTCAVLDQCNAMRVGEIGDVLADGDANDPAFQQLKQAVNDWDAMKQVFDNVDADFQKAYDEGNRLWKSGQLTEERLNQILTDLQPNAIKLIDAGSGVVKATQALWNKYQEYKTAKGL